MKILTKRRVDNSFSGQFLALFLVYAPLVSGGKAGLFCLYDPINLAGAVTKLYEINKKNIFWGAEIRIFGYISEP